MRITEFGTGSSSLSTTIPLMFIFKSGRMNEYMWSYPRPSARFELKYPLSPLPKVMPKSSDDEFMGVPMFTTFHPPIGVIWALKISRPPSPACPLLEKYIIESVRMYGNSSSPGVFMNSPRFSSDPARSFKFMRHMSFPPYPPGISEQKYSQFPSGDTAGCP